MSTSKTLARSIKKLLQYRNYSANVAKKQSVWTQDYTVKSPYNDVEIPNTTIADYIWENLDKWADKTAVICAVTNRSYSYHQLYKYSRNFASRLRKSFGISDGDVVCVMMHNSPEYPVATLGALQAGAVVTTVNPIYTAHEVQKQIILSNPKVVVGTPETVNVIKEALQLAKKEARVIIVQNEYESLPTETVSFQELIKDDSVDHTVLKEVKRNGEDNAFLPCSSGTTGLPKGVDLIHRNITVNLLQQNVEGIKRYNDTTSSHQDSVLAILPFFHIYGLSTVMLHKLSVGTKLVTLPRFHPSTLLKTLEDHKINLFYAAPPLVLFLGSHANVTPKHLSSIDKIMSAAAPLPKHDINKVLEKSKSNLNFVQLYGLTETGPIVTSTVPGSDNYITVGHALPNTELKIVDSDLRSLAPNEVGELLIRGPQVMKGYRNNPEATRNAITVDGWLRSGDLASINEDGIVTIADRLKELIKVKGFQVPPAELESVIKEHPDVLDAGVIGIPDERTGEAPKAFVVLKDGHKISTDDILNFVKSRVADYKKVKEVMFLDNLPKNPSGKLLRRVLREKFS